MSRQEDFDQACRAFFLFDSAERLLALQEFARLRYPSAADRFFEAVYVVINQQRERGVLSTRKDLA